MPARERESGELPPPLWPLSGRKAGQGLLIFGQRSGVRLFWERKQGGIDWRVDLDGLHFDGRVGHSFSIEGNLSAER